MRSYIFVAFLCIGMLSSCVKDRSFPPLETIYLQPGLPKLDGRTLIHYWNFNSGSLLAPTETKGGASLSYTGSSAVYDAVSPGTALNARKGDAEGSALRLRNPSGVFELNLSTVNYRDVILSFDLQRTDNGAQLNKISYSIDGVNFTTEGLKPAMHQVSINWQTFAYDFSSIAQVSNNPNFKVRIEFDINHDGASGNNRFDNIALDGNIIDPNFGTPEILHYWNFNTTSTLLTPTQTIGGGALDYPNNPSSSGLAYYDSANPGSPINARNGDAEGSVLRLRNPAGTFTITAPTTGYRTIKLSFAVMRTGSGAQQNIITYTLDGTNYISTGIATNTYNPTLEPEYTLINYDFSAITGINNNPNFKIRIDFANGNTNASGNNRFDNIVIEGVRL